jgi:hypothetical protein
VDVMTSREPMLQKTSESTHSTRLVSTHMAIVCVCCLMCSLPQVPVDVITLSTQMEILSAAAKHGLATSKDAADCIYFRSRNVIRSLLRTLGLF